MFPLYVPLKKSNNIFGLFRPVYVFARLWGYVPFSVNFDSFPLPTTVKISLVNRILLLIQTLAYLSCLALSLINHKRNTRKITSLVLHGLNKVNEFGIFCGLLFVLADVANRHKVWRIFRTFIRFDREMYTVSACSVDYANARQSIKWYVTVWITLSVSVSIYTIVIHTNYHRLAVAVIGYIILLTVTSIYVSVLSVYSFLLQNAKIRFTVLNKSLRRLFEANLKITEAPITGDDTCYTVMKIAKLHGQLNDIIDESNACYSIQVMFCFAGIFSYLVFGVYSLYRIWFVADNMFGNRQFLMTTVHVFWSIFYLWLGLFVVYLGSSTLSEAKYTGVIIHKCINITQNHIIVERLIAFSQQLLHRTPDANCKLFSFDWTLIIAATVSYLMILAQFDVSNNNIQELAAYNCMTAIIQKNITSLR